ncbi:MAG: serine/threonine protein kinase, partial [Proteobacteria bacterium]
MSSTPVPLSRPLPDGLAPGTLVAGKFRLERLLGEGGIGLVFAATHIELDERVALKFMRPEMMQNTDIVERFAQEARAAARLKTEHVARVLDVGKHGATPFMVMELLQGRDMQRVVIDDGPMPFELAVELLIQACEALAEAHGRGIVHRDVKPENLFVVERDGMQHLKVLDFGISKVALSGKISDVDLTSRRTVSIMGSPYYMSPEQIRSTRDVDHRADIWSLGASLFEATTGHTAFPDGREFTELMFDIVQ